MSDVKSAKRVFEFLEYFASVQREITVAEVAKEFGYPNSSVSSILRTMVSLGYLTYDRSKRTYLPSARVPFLSSWIGTQLFEKEALLQMMDELSSLTGAAIMLGTLNGLSCQYVHILPATSAVRLHTSPGFRPLARTACGLALLSQLEKNYVTRLMTRIGAEDPLEAVNVRDLLARLEAIRRDGHVLSVNALVRGGGAVAVPLPKRKDTTPMAISVGNVEAVLRDKHQEYAELIKSCIAKYFSA
jgi:DNA-binding IclR family transcriptional regulator